MTDTTADTARWPCACRKCAPILYPPESHGPQQGEGHASTRFGDRAFTTILLDGVELVLCVEAFAPVTGEGWVIEGRYDRPKHLCMHTCNATGHPEPCEIVRRGRVIIQRQLTTP